MTFQQRYFKNQSLGLRIDHAAIGQLRRESQTSLVLAYTNEPLPYVHAYMYCFLQPKQVI